MRIWEGFLQTWVTWIFSNVLSYFLSPILVMWILAISIIARYLVPKSVGCKIVSVIPSLS